MCSLLWQWSKHCLILLRYTQVISRHFCWFLHWLSCCSICYSIEPWEKRWLKRLSSQMYIFNSLLCCSIFIYRQWLCSSNPWWQALAYIESQRQHWQIPIFKHEKSLDIYLSNRDKLHSINKVTAIMGSHHYRWW